MRLANIIAYILVIVGAVNWGLFGLFDFNLVSMVFNGARATGSIITYSIIALAALWLAQWELGFIEGVLPEWLSFENDELPIITLYLAYIPVFISFMVKDKELKGWQRFVIIPLGIASCLFMVYSAVSAYKMDALYYLIVSSVIMAVGMAFYRIGGRPLALITLEKMKTKKSATEK